MHVTRLIDILAKLKDAEPTANVEFSSCDEDGKRQTEDVGLAILFDGTITLYPRED